MAAPRLRARIGVMVAHSGWGGGGHGDRMTQRSRRGDQEINSILMRICKFISRACDYGLTRDVGSERRFVVDLRRVDQSASSAAMNTGKPNFLCQ